MSAVVTSVHKESGITGSGVDQIGRNRSGHIENVVHASGHQDVRVPIKSECFLSIVGLAASRPVLLHPRTHSPALRS